MFHLPVYLCITCISGAHKNQKRVPDSWNWFTDSCELTYGFLEWNLGPLEEQPGLLISEPSLQPHVFINL